MCSASERRGVVAARVDVGIAIGSNTSTASLPELQLQALCYQKELEWYAFFNLACVQNGSLVNPSRHQHL